MSIQRAHWLTDGDSIRLNMPLQKVDKENRIVSGFATLDNIDTSNDVVLASASQRAFENFRGNIRLMHQPIPAGKLVNFRPEEYYDPQTQKFYKGIYVDVYVSKGAPEVWEMVLDGTLTGFSIGGQVTDAESEFVKDAGKVIRFIKAYDLVELSLVDSPANQLCDIFSITKTANGMTMSGMLSKMTAENVFWCDTDQIAFASAEDAKDCNVCGNATENIGWFENDGGDKAEKVNTIVEGRLNKLATDVTANTEELEVEPQTEPTPLVVDGEGPDGGVALGPDTEGDREDALEDAEELKEAEDEEAGETEEPGEEDDDSENPNFGKMFAELSDVIQKTLEQNQELTAAQLVKVNDQLAALNAVADQFEELTKTVESLREGFSALKSQVENVEKSYSAVEKSVGLKKSGDLGGSKEDVVEKSTTSKWGGRFFGSVENLG